MMKNSCMHAAVRELGTLFNEGAVGMLSDGQLLGRFVERRDASAFEAILERYGPLVWGVCRRVLGNHHDAEDAFQATFLVLARKAASVMPREKLGNWLYGVAFQTAMNAKAARAKRWVRERLAWEMTQPEAVPREHVYADELLSRLDREVARLPEKYRLPVILCELEGKTHRQAAEQLQWPVGTVSGRLSRARALLASRLSRAGTPLTGAALGILLADDVAQAGMPPELVRSTAQAASCSTAGKAAAAGVVSGQVAVLTGEILKTMLLNKLTLSTAVLLCALVLAAGGTSLTYRAHAAEPANPKQGSENHPERSRVADAANEDMPPAATQPSFTKAAIENNESAPNRLSGVEAMSTSSPEEIQPSALDPPHYHWGYSFTSSSTGNVALAYNPQTGEVKPVRLNATQKDPIKVTTKVTTGKCLVGLQLEGRKITRVAVFDPESGKWSPLDLDEPASGVVQPTAFGRTGLGYQVGRFLYLYSAKTSTWDRLEPQAITNGQPIKVTLMELNGTGVLAMRLEGSKIPRLAVFNLEARTWSTLDLDEPASGVVQPMVLGPGAAAYEIGQYLYVYRAETSKWDRLDLQSVAEDKPSAPATKRR
jgi:RNA polymerase sigma factor (sigma-70 family)